MSAIIAVTLVVLNLGPQAVPPAAAAAAATGIIRGVVTEKETGQPIPRAAVTVRFPSSNITRQTLAGSDGRYEFTSVPAGAFEVLATGGELRAVYVEGWNAPPQGGRVERLEEGEVKAGVNIALARALAISGRVLNDSGEPLARVRVLVRRAGTDSNAVFGRVRTTDDRGMFRVFGLEPGRYVVCTERPTMSGIGVAGVGMAERYIETCHPDSKPSAAQVVVVTTADAEGIDIRMRRSRTFSISGTLRDASGQPLERALVSLHEIVGDGERSTGAAVLPGGRFVVTGLVPGQYAVSADIGGPNQPEANRELERAYTPVDVVDRDVEGLVLTTRKAALVSGRIVYETGTPPPIRPGRPPMTVEVARDPDSMRRSGSNFVRPAQVSEDLTFALSGVFGRQKLAVVNPPPGGSSSPSGTAATTSPTRRSSSGRARIRSRSC